jgi:hypothetical protein
LDGSVLFLQRNIGDAVVYSQGKRKEGEKFKITITFTNEISKKQEVVFQLYNVCMLVWASSALGYVRIAMLSGNV